MQVSRNTDARWSTAAIAVPVVCLLLKWVVGKASSVAQSLALRFNIDPFRRIGAVHVVSAGKVATYKSLSLVLTAFAAATCLLAFAKGARRAALAGLVVSAAVYTLILMLRSAVHPAMNAMIAHFAWQDVSAGVDFAEWEPAGQRRGALQSFADVKPYSAEADRALRSMGTDSTLRRAAFFTAMASHWWAPGNVVERRKIGCVRQNEHTRHLVVAEQDVNFVLYRDAGIGCCDDFSHLLKLLLDGRHIPSRLVIPAGHAFNEATIGRQRHLLDATNAIVVSASWDAINRGAAQGTA